MASNKPFPITRLLACALAAGNLVGCSVTGPRESPLKEVTRTAPRCWTSTVARACPARQSPRGRAGVQAGLGQETARDRLERDSQVRPIAHGDGGTARYWSAQEPMQQRFARVANPDLVMVVYPHLARGKYPVPGYVTVFPMYESTEYAMPASTEDLQRGRAAFSGRAGGGSPLMNILDLILGGKAKTSSTPSNPPTSTPSAGQAARDVPAPAAERPMTVRDRQRMAQRPPSFTEMLPYVTYSPGEQVFVMRDGATWGAMFELDPVATEAQPLSYLQERCDKVRSDHGPARIRHHALDRAVVCQ